MNENRRERERERERRRGDTKEERAWGRGEEIKMERKGTVIK